MSRDYIRRQEKIDFAAQQIIRAEGPAPYLYVDTKGYITMGHGHKLEVGSKKDIAESRRFFIKQPMYIKKPGSAAKEIDYFTDRLATEEEKGREFDKFIARYGNVGKNNTLASKYYEDINLILAPEAVQSILSDDIHERVEGVESKTFDLYYDVMDKNMFAAHVDSIFQTANPNGALNATKNFRAAYERGDWVGMLRNLTTVNKDPNTGLPNHDFEDRNRERIALALGKKENDPLVDVVFNALQRERRYNYFAAKHPEYGGLKARQAELMEKFAPIWAERQNFLQQLYADPNAAPEAGLAGQDLPGLDPELLRAAGIKQGSDKGLLQAASLMSAAELAELKAISKQLTRVESEWTPFKVQEAYKPKQISYGDFSVEENLLSLEQTAQAHVPEEILHPEIPYNSALPEEEANAQSENLAYDRYAHKFREPIGAELEKPKLEGRQHLQEQVTSQIGARSTQNERSEARYNRETGKFEIAPDGKLADKVDVKPSLIKPESPFDTRLQGAVQFDAATGKFEENPRIEKVLTAEVEGAPKVAREESLSRAVADGVGYTSAPSRASREEQRSRMEARYNEQTGEFEVPPVEVTAAPGLSAQERQQLEQLFGVQLGLGAGLFPREDAGNESDHGFTVNGQTPPPFLVLSDPETRSQQMLVVSEADQESASRRAQGQEAQNSGAGSGLVGRRESAPVPRTALESALLALPQLVAGGDQQAEAKKTGPSVGQRLGAALQKTAGRVGAVFSSGFQKSLAQLLQGSGGAAGEAGGAGGSYAHAGGSYVHAGGPTARQRVMALWQGDAAAGPAFNPFSLEAPDMEPAAAKKVLAKTYTNNPDPLLRDALMNKSHPLHPRTMRNRRKLMERATEGSVG